MLNSGFDLSDKFIRYSGGFGKAIFDAAMQDYTYGSLDRA